MKNKAFNFLLLLNLVSIGAIAQTKFTLPNKYKIYKDFEGKEQKLYSDFDNDGINDLAAVCIDSEENNLILISLSSSLPNGQGYNIFYHFAEGYSFEFKNRVLTISSSNCIGRCWATFKLRYQTEIKNLKLIGYEQGSYPNGNTGEGGYGISINLITGEYEKEKGKRKKAKFELITLTNLDSKLAYLESLIETLQ